MKVGFILTTKVFAPCSLLSVPYPEGVVNLSKETMVERPIKKSERQAQANTDNNVEKLDSTPPVESNPKSSKPDRNRSSGKGKKGSFADENKPPVNPALMRAQNPLNLQLKLKKKWKPNLSLSQRSLKVNIFPNSSRK